jgi:hypothetical protein
MPYTISRGGWYRFIFELLRSVFRSDPDPDSVGYVDLDPDWEKFHVLKCRMFSLRGLECSPVAWKPFLKVFKNKNIAFLF